MKQFFASEVEVLSENAKKSIIKNVEELTKKQLWNGNEWILDYRKLG